MNKNAMKIGQLAKATGLTSKTIRYYELLRLLDEPPRTSSGYRLYGQEQVERLGFIKKAKGLGLSLDEIRDILTLHHQRQRPCKHVLALLDQKIAEVDELIHSLKLFRQDLAQLRNQSVAALDDIGDKAAICGIIEQGIHGRGIHALAWLERRRKGHS